RFNIEKHSNGKSAEERVFLFSGALTLRKGVDLLAQAFNELACEGAHVKLRIVGDGPLLPQLQTTLAHAHSNVTFVGFKDWAELPSEYAKADVLCVPSRYDGWGLVIPEGLAAGLPVIATDQMGSALEFIKSGENGWLVRAGDYQELLSAMRDAAKASANELATYSSNARGAVCNHTLQDGARRFLRYANEVVANWA
ncbi:MAG TPA: glycosyltransferase family 4 protein, partial [Pyrinomonadaceae bacterium]